MKPQLRSQLNIVLALLLTPTILRSQLLAPTDVRALAKEFVTRVANGDFVAATSSFDATMKGALPASKLEQTWKMLISQIGAFKHITGVRTETVQQYEIVYVTCEHSRSPIDVKVVFNRSNQIAGLFFVPIQARPADPSSTAPSPNEQEVTVGKGEWALPGTLALPEGNGLFPAVVLVHGSGPHDRDETIGPHKPFRDLSRGLTAKGIAVLRYEKRTKQHAAKLAALSKHITVKEETIDDALAGVALLRVTRGIDPARIFVLGHSLGGMLLPRIEEADPDVAGLIALAGPTRPMEDIILSQTHHLANLDGTVTTEEQTQIDSTRMQVQRVKDPHLSTATPPTALPLGIPALYWLELRGYNPSAVAKGLKHPMLILQGEQDWQVTMEDFAGWKNLLSSRPNVAFKSYPKLNHLFVEDGKNNHVHAEVIADIAAWIHRQSE